MKKSAKLPPVTTKRPGALTLTRTTVHTLEANQLADVQGGRIGMDATNRPTTD